MYKTHKTAKQRTAKHIKPVLCTLGVVGLMFGLTGCKTTEAARPAPVVVQAPTPQVTEPAPPPPLTIPERPVSERMNEALIRHAGNYAVLRNQVALAETGDINTAADMNAMMDGLSRVYSPSLGPALLGYGAMIGAQNSEFVEGVRETARYEGLDTVVYRLYANPDYAATLPGATAAARDIQTAWNSDIAAMGRAGANIKAQSYSLQQRPEWKKMRSDDRKARIDAISRAKSIRFDPPTSTREKLAAIGAIRADDGLAAQKRQQFWQVYGRLSAPQSQSFPSQYKGEMNKRALTLAALEILGATGRDSTIWIENYMTSPRLTQCVNTARLNTEQCLAAGHFKYEDAFCIARHELTEISNCLTKSAM
ncbi:MAG TPA: hypothetical protein ENK01_00785 [Hellea balneolensis]|uniref:Uncharacterized protein n=1 Tax=Hellea balneolensis TaxID=287478 RepID=A0A7V5NWT5_9PROT|nr:hypothetical protein [Hellea balneolensis]